MSLSLFIARRLYRTKGEKDRISSLGVNIASLGVAIGLAIMLVSVAVVLGFKDEIRSKVVGFGSHIQLLNADAASAADGLPVQVSDSLLQALRCVDGVSHIQRVSQKTGILKTEDEFKGVSFKGVGEDFDSRFLSKYIVAGRLPDFGQDSSAQQIVISQAIANELSLEAGDRVYAYFFGSELRMRRYLISGVYQTNMSQFDNNIVFANRLSINKLNEWEVNECSLLELSVNDFERNEDIADRVACQKPQRPDENGCFYAIYSIRELYGAIFDWLKLLDLNIWVILGLMTAVCCFTMICGLFILILEKTQTIGILKALGASNRMVRRIFLHYGVFIIGRGLLCGNILGLLICFVQWKWHFVGLDASNYYVDHVPVAFNWIAILGINISTLLICTLILIAPTLIVSSIRPVKALKFD